MTCLLETGSRAVIDYGKAIQDVLMDATRVLAKRYVEHPLDLEAFNASQDLDETSLERKFYYDVLCTSAKKSLNS
jgi:hypothetical protein